MPESRSSKKPAASAEAPTPGTKKAAGNPRWLVPTMLTLMIVGLLWVVVTYLTQTAYPIPGLGNWNLAVGFVIMFAGFSLTLRWR